MVPKLEAVRRAQGNWSLGISERRRGRRLGTEEAESRVGKSGFGTLPLFTNKSLRDTQSELGNPGVWRGLSNILIYFLKLFGKRKSPSPSAKPPPHLSICKNPSAVQGKSDSCVFNSFTLNVLKYCFVRAI